MMGLGFCLTREMRHRPGGAALALLALLVASAAVIGALGLVRSHDAETGRLVGELQQRAAERMRTLNNEARIFSKSLGFNILLLPAEQDLARFWANDASDVYLDPASVATLGQADLATLNHLLPVLRQRIEWPAVGGPVTLIGIQGQIYIKNPAKQKPIQEDIASGQVLLGANLHQRLGVKPGDTVSLRGRRFTVARCLEAKGNADDIAVLMNLGDAQELLEKPGAISGILALSCECAGGELAPIRAELARHVSGLQVVEFTVRARARERARGSIRAAATAEIEDIETSRGLLRAQLTTFAGASVAVVAIAAGVLVLILTLGNVRERRGEIAILRTLGYARGQILFLLLGKAALIGAVAGVLGVGGAALLALVLGAPPLGALPLLMVSGATLLLAVLAALPPAWSAASTDPATILNQEGP